MNNQLLDDLEELNDSPESQKRELLKLKKVFVLVTAIGLALFFIIRYFALLLGYHRISESNDYVEYVLSVLIIGATLSYHYGLAVNTLMPNFFTFITPPKKIKILAWCGYIHNLLLAPVALAVIVIGCFLILGIPWLILYYVYAIKFDILSYAFDFGILVFLLAMNIYDSFSIFKRYIIDYYSGKKNTNEIEYNVFMNSHNLTSDRVVNTFASKTMHLSVFVLGLALFLLIRHYAMLYWVYHEVFHVDNNNNINEVNNENKLKCFLVGVVFLSAYWEVLLAIMQRLFISINKRKWYAFLFSYAKALLTAILTLFFIILFCFLILLIISGILSVCGTDSIVHYTFDFSIVMSLLMITWYSQEEMQAYHKSLVNNKE